MTDKGYIRLSKLYLKQKEVLLYRIYLGFMFQKVIDVL